jgi:hypothetical protein
VYKEDVIDIMSAAILKSQEDMMKYRGMSDTEISDNLNWSKPQIDHANELILNELIKHNIVPEENIS